MQAPESLTCHLRNKQFATLIEERTHNFVGRRFIFNAINGLISDSEFTSGYIQIVGEPGVGKTSLIAQLIKEHQYIHHFNIRSQGITSTSAFIKNICVQLIINYQLNYHSLPVESDRDGGFLSTLLLEASSRRENEAVVILVDALDEAEDNTFLSNSEANKLLLPSTLPTGVFFVLTTREQTDYQLLVDQEEFIYLNDEAPQNLDDIRLYIRNYIQRYSHQMNAAFINWSITHEDFIKLITDKSHGNFMYLVYVMRDILAGKLNSTNIDDLRNLPTGLKNYYRQHWNRMKKSDEGIFKELYEPVVCTLAAAKEPISFSKICEITNLPPTDTKRVLDEWREFLNESENETGEKKFRLYHSSFRDFLDEEVNLISYHGQIAQSLKNKTL